MTNVSDAAVLALKQLVQEGQRDGLERATTINTLRARLNQLEAVTNEMVVASAEAEPAVAALDEWERYLMDRVRLEKEACGEPGMWARTPVGNSVALTLYQDLANQLVQVRKSYGL